MCLAPLPWNIEVQREEDPNTPKRKCENNSQEWHGCLGEMLSARRQPTSVWEKLLSDFSCLLGKGMSSYCGPALVTSEYWHPGHTLRILNVNPQPRARQALSPELPFPAAV